MKALVLSGGGAKGAYQVGVLSRWLGEEHRHYDIICGVSVGALNGSFIAQFPKGSEKEASAALVALWKSITTARIYKKWWGGEIAAIWKPSVYDSTPLQALVRKGLDLKKLRASGKKLRIGAVSLRSGEYVAFGEGSDLIVDAVLASSSFPAMLLPVKIGNDLWTDGGVRDVTPLAAAIDLGATEIDAVVCSPSGVKAGFPEVVNALKVAERSIDIMSDEIIENDLKLAGYVNRMVRAGAAPEKRYVEINVLRPENQLTDNSLDFDPRKLEAMMLVGYTDAKAN